MLVTLCKLYQLVHIYAGIYTSIDCGVFHLKWILAMRSNGWDRHNLIFPEISAIYWPEKIFESKCFHTRLCCCLPVVRNTWWACLFMWMTGGDGWWCDVRQWLEMHEQIQRCKNNVCKSTMHVVRTEGTVHKVVCISHTLVMESCQQTSKWCLLQYIEYYNISIRRW